MCSSSGSSCGYLTCSADSGLDASSLEIANLAAVHAQDQMQIAEALSLHFAQYASEATQIISTASNLIG